MKLFDRSEPGAWVSGAAHAAILAAAIVGLSWDKLPDAEEGIAVEVVSDSLFAEMTRGERQVETVRPELKPRAERVAETPEERPPGEAARDVPSPPTRPPEITVAEREAAPPPPPPPPPMPPRREVAKVEPPPAPPRREVDRKPEAKAEPKREETAKLVEREAEEADARTKAAAEREKAAADAKARAEAQARQKAESEARERAKAEAKAVAEAKERARIEEAKAVAEAKLQAEIKAKQEAEARAKREAEVADRFNPGDIRKLLGLKEPAQSTGATGREVQRTAALGTATGNAQRLNPSQLGALKALLQDQIRNNYLEVPGSKNDSVTIPVLQIRLNRDGSLAAEPRLLRVGPKPIDRAVAEAALRAVRRSAPFRIPAQYAPFYEDWKELNPEFTAE